MGLGVSLVFVIMHCRDDYLERQRLAKILTASQLNQIISQNVAWVWHMFICGI